MTSDNVTLRDLMELRIGNIEKDVAEIKATLQWILRTIVAAFVVSIAGAIIAQVAR